MFPVWSYNAESYGEIEPNVCLARGVCYFLVFNTESYGKRESNHGWSVGGRLRMLTGGRLHSPLFLSVYSLQQLILWEIQTKYRLKCRGQRAGIMTIFGGGELNFINRSETVVVKEPILSWNISQR